MTAPTQRSGGLDANARGIAVLVAAVAIGFLLLLKAGDGGGDAATLVASDKTTTTVDIGGIGSTTTTTPGSSSSTTTTASSGGRQPSEVTVLVLNASGPAGSAAATSQTIGAAGYKMGSPTNASGSLDKTTIYYATGFQAEATAVAGLLGRTSAAVQAMPSPVPGPGADKANVVVVLGKDPVSAGTSSSSTTTTTAPG